MSKISDSAVRPYIENHRAALLGDPTEWLHIPSVPARHERTADIRRSADRLAAKLRATGFPTGESGAGPAADLRDVLAAPMPRGAA
ncbi:hypothetical protein [Streptomyces sp. NBC_00286]|uniref:hypothetical protein n=1 Tax=Streptomyces sp. NBC_00286 TaxID=2975701 RepID=UPI002E27E190|nr:hypothetical protein [Streptomyces sp. NBC_00286]